MNKHERLLNLMGTMNSVQRTRYEELGGGAQGLLALADEEIAAAKITAFAWTPFLHAFVDEMKSTLAMAGAAA